MLGVAQPAALQMSVIEARYRVCYRESYPVQILGTNRRPEMPAGPPTSMSQSSR